MRYGFRKGSRGWSPVTFPDPNLRGSSSSKLFLVRMAVRGNSGYAGSPYPAATNYEWGKSLVVNEDTSVPREASQFVLGHSEIHRWVSIAEIES